MAQTIQMKDIQNAVAELGKQYGTERIFLFGSFARGEAVADSDVDLRIEKGRIRGLFALSGLHLDLEKRLGRKVDLLASDSLDDDFLETIRPEEVPLYAHE